MEGFSVKRDTAPSFDVWSDHRQHYNRNGQQFGYQTHDRGFRLEEAVNQHMELENYLSRLKCRISDQQSRSGQAANQRTTAAGNKNPNISCKMCLRKFQTQSAANEHMKFVGHMEANIPCKMCPRKFQTRIAANEHMKAVGHLNPDIPCKTCSKKFYTQSAANEHMTAVKH
jgi:hypothetical protein